MTTTTKEPCDHAARWDDWATVGRCLYCPCGQRLYQARKPRNETEARRNLDAISDILYGIATIHEQHDWPDDRHA